MASDPPGAPADADGSDAPSPVKVALAGVLGVVFDMDDTLFAELDFARGGFATAAAAISDRFGIGARVVDDALERELASLLAGTGRHGHIFDRVLEEFGLPIDQETIVWLVSTYRDHRPDIAPFPDVVPALEGLAGRAKVGLITDGPGDVQRAKFDALGLERFFDAVLFTDDLGREHWKPSARAYERMEAALGLPGEALVYVADNPAKDFIGARARGWRTLRIRREMSLHGGAEPAPGYEPDGEIETLADLTAMLTKGWA